MSYIVQRAAKFAIKDSIEAQVRASKEKGEEDVEMKGDGAAAEEESDPVPYITTSHFEEAMKTAQRSVSDAELRRYEAYALQLMASRGQFTNFKFNQGGASFGAEQQNQEEEDDLYS